MISNKDPYKITKDFKYFIVIFTLVGIGFVSFIEYAGGRDWKEPLIMGFVMVACFIPVLVVSIRGARKNYERLKEEKQLQSEKLKLIYTYGSLSGVLGFLMMGRGHIQGLITGLLWIICGAGLVSRKKWSCWLFIILALYCSGNLLLSFPAILTNIVNELKQKNVSFVISYSFYFLSLLLFSVSGIYVLTRPKVKEQFK